MKIIRNLFLIGLVNFVLLLGLFSAASITTTNQITQPINVGLPQPTVTSIQKTEVTTPTITPNNLSKTPSPTSQVVKTTPSATPAPNTPTPDPLAGKCIIYISGSRYDVTDFRNIHSGGDIFQCGTDMTDIFNGQHPASYLDKMTKYKI